MGTTELLLCNGWSQTCDARLWGCSQNRTTFTLWGYSCSWFRLLLSVANTGKALINEDVSFNFRCYEPRGQEFESLRAHQQFNGLGQKWLNPFFLSTGTFWGLWVSNLSRRIMARLRFTRLRSSVMRFNASMLAFRLRPRSSLSGLHGNQDIQGSGCGRGTRVY